MGRATGPDGMTILFYRREAVATPPERLRLPPGMRLQSWRPRTDGPPARGAHRRENLVWYAFDRLGLFASDAFEELTVWRGDRLAHRQVVTPRWWRFPFMADDDLQIGALWTDPELRRIGVASAVMGEAHQRHGGGGARFWYLADEANGASQGLALVRGYRLVGTGRRTQPFGLSALGRFRLESPATPIGS